jgi:hypothetical protein
MKPKRNKKVWPLRTETQRQLVCRLLFIGVKTERIAKRLHCSAETIRDLIATPEFQTLYATYERQQLARVDRALPRLLTEAMDALIKLLKHPDWHARDAALEKIMSLHGPVLEQFIARLHEHRQDVPQQPLDDMTPEQRDATRAYLAAMRQAVGQRRALPSGLQPPLSPE